MIQHCRCSLWLTKSLRAIQPIVAASIGLSLFLGPHTIVSGRHDNLNANTATRTADSPQEQKEMPLPAPGASIEREMKGSDIHGYQIALTSGQFLHVIVDQVSIDIAVSLFGSDGKQIIKVDRADAAHTPEPVSLLAEKAGEYRIVVEPRSKDTAPGRYVLRVIELRPGTPQDEKRIKAQALFTEGEALYAQGNEVEMKRAVERYEAAIKLWRDVDDRAGQAYGLTNIGLIYSDTSDQEKALEYYAQALPLWRAVGERVGEAETLNNMGVSLGDLGEIEKAFDHYNQSLRMRRELSDRRGEARTLGNIGTLHSLVGDSRKAIEYFQQALPPLRAAGDKLEQAITLNNIGKVYSDLGEHQKALEHLRQSIPLYQAVGDRNGEGVALNNIGLAHDFLGEKQKALDSYAQALPLLRVTGDRQTEAATLGNLGLIYSSLGEKQKALDYYEESLQIKRAINDRRGQGVTLVNTGSVYASMHEDKKALEKYEQALKLFQDVGDKRGQSIALSAIGNSYTNLRDYKRALDYLNQSLPLKRATGERRGEAIALAVIGKVHAALGETEKALDHFNQALILNRAVSDRIGEAATLYSIARLEMDRGRLDDARSQIEASLKLIESLRVGVVSQELRASFFASKREYYELYIDILMLLHKQRPLENFHALALQASERGRARSLLELLAEARADIRQGVAPELLERERSLQQRLNDKADRQTRLLGGKHTKQQAETAAKEIEGLTAEYRDLQSQIRATNPRYAALTQPVPLTLSEIQAEVLDRNTLLLEYALGEQRSYLWVVTKNSLTSYELPKRAEIEEAARRVYSALTSGHQQPNQSTQRDVKLNESAKTYHDAAEQLSRIILAPASRQLRNQRLIIVADGALQYVPFSALPVPAAQGPGISRNAKRHVNANASPLLESRPPLIAEHEIVSLPSASTLAALRRETTGRQPAAKLVAVLADPVFAPDDERLRSVRVSSGSSQNVAEDRALRTSATELGVGGLEFRIPRLPGTRREAEQILNLAPAADRMQALDFAASRTTAVSDKLREYRYLHFATHGFLNSVHPELSGIVLSMFDEKGMQQNGFLRVHEIFNLDLPAELVVLSACQTGLGKEVKGEGLVGLTRGFMYAGSPRVVVSLWSVSDVATAELMTRFYRSMLKENLRPAAALRAAQIQMLRQKRWQEPFYWAAFTLQGEWR